ncbi:hypothetical protein, partial [Pseudomonas sp. DP16D-T1]|uniref:hypothetical protein n=1 Tax=Pseudomonas sp. DP16D-T1 TaxID=2751314 RepID=UPI001A91D4D4
MIGSIIQPPDLTNSHTVNAPSQKGRHSTIGPPEGSSAEGQGIGVPGWEAYSVTSVVPGRSSAARAALDLTGAENTMA